MTVFAQEALARLSDPEAVRIASLDHNNINRTPFGETRVSWNELSLACGYPGLALLFATLGQEDVVHQYVLKIKETIERDGLYDLSLFNGVTGISFALQVASCGGTRYQKMLEVLQEFLIGHIEESYLFALRKNQQVGLPSSPRLYDPIQGVSGIGRYALENLRDVRFEKLAREIASVLVGFSHPFVYKYQQLYGWWVSPTDALNVKQRDLYPKGNFNLGLAHGVTGIVAYLSIAMLKGVVVEGQREALEKFVRWIREQAFLSEGEIVWPYNVSWEEEMEGAKRRDIVCKDGWCYGVPGVARTLFLAGKALQDEELKAFAQKAFWGVVTRGREKWQLVSTTLCHGFAGLLTIAQEMAKEGAGEAFCKEMEQLVLSEYEEGSLWGFRDTERSKDGKFCKINKAGFLEGAAGVWLSLLPAEDTRWKLPLLIHE